MKRKPGKEVLTDYGIASAILGAVSIVLFWTILFSIVSGILAIVFAAKQRKTSSHPAATVGMITGIVGIVCAILFLIAVCLIMFFIFLQTASLPAA